MSELFPFLPTALVLYIIIRRGTRPQRVKPGRLWVFPALIAFLAFTAIGSGKTPTPAEITIYAGAVLAGGVFGWFTTQHVELTLDDKTGTVMSQPSKFATAATVAIFLARFLAGYVSGGHGSAAWKDFLVAHGASLVLITNTGLLFIASRGLSRAWHMMARINPMIEAHRAAKIAQASATPPSPPI